MAKYAILINWTEQGVTNVKDTVTRYQAAKQMVESKGGTFDAILWTAGPYDMVAITDVPDEETATAINLQLAAAGNLRTLTMRGFTEDEMTGIISKMG
jgi:uncharacterized protein with GYD domain